MYKNLNSDEKGTINSRRDRSLDTTQPLETIAETQVIHFEDRNSQFQPIQISNSRLPLQQTPAPTPQKRRKGCGCFFWGLLISLLTVFIVYLLLPFRTNVLILGVDRSPDGSFLGRTDTIMLLSVIPLKPDVNLLSIPRDLWVNIPGVGENRINTAHFFAEANQPGTGPQATMLTIQDNFGVHVRYYVRFSFDSVKEIVNALGGIPIEIPVPMSGYDPGVYTLDGDQALAFARDRQGSDDFFRMQRGQMVVQAVIKQLLNPTSWPKIPEIILTTLQVVDTNVPFYEIPRIGIAVVRAMLSNTINGQTISREMVYPTTTAEGANVLLPNWELINPLLMEMFGE